MRPQLRSWGPKVVRVKPPQQSKKPKEGILNLQDARYIVLQDTDAPPRNTVTWNRIAQNGGARTPTADDIGLQRTMQRHIAPPPAPPMFTPEERQQALRDMITHLNAPMQELVENEDYVDYDPQDEPRDVPERDYDTNA